MVTNMLIKILKKTWSIFNYLKFLFHVFVLFCFVLLESSGGETKTPSAFVFFLNNFKGLAPFVSELKTGNTIYRGSTFGPTFGQDLYIFYNARLTGRHWYWTSAIPTLFQLQWQTSCTSWPCKERTSYLMRWRYFILTHPSKCKITRTEFN